MYSNNASAVGTNEVADIHNKNCANILTAYSYDVKTYSGLVHTAFHIDVTSDVEGVHPPKCCLKCYAVLLNVKKEGSIPTYTAASWEPHSSDCLTCRIQREKSKGGRPSKRSKATGRPKAVVSVSDLMNIDASRPISSSVERAVAHVLKIKSQQSTSKTIEIKTGGSQPMTLTHIPIARKELQ